MKEPSSIVKDIVLEKSDKFFGFCIRGGKQKPLGISVVSVDPGGAAGTLFYDLMLNIFDLNEKISYSRD